MKIQNLSQGIRKIDAFLRGKFLPSVLLLLPLVAASSCTVGGVGASDVLEASRRYRGDAGALEIGSIMADFALGNKFAEKDPKRAAEYYRKAAEFGLPEAQFNLGVLHRQGRGIPQDYAEAAKWFRRAAEQGMPPAQYNLGISYLKGEGVPESFRDAYIWFTLAGIGGHKQGEEAALKVVPQFPTRDDLKKAQDEGRRIYDEIQSGQGKARPVE